MSAATDEVVATGHCLTVLDHQGLLASWTPFAVINWAPFLQQLVGEEQKKGKKSSIKTSNNTNNR